MRIAAQARARARRRLPRPEVGGEQGTVRRGEGTVVHWLANNLVNADVNAATETWKARASAS
eukprot:5538538-Pleurochrysis_carterae.AAC.1